MLLGLFSPYMFTSYALRIALEHDMEAMAQQHPGFRRRPRAPLLPKMAHKLEPGECQYRPTGSKRSRRRNRGK